MVSTHGDLINYIFFGVVKPEELYCRHPDNLNGVVSSLVRAPNSSTGGHEFNP
jgi:hypothetical protein